MEWDRSGAWVQNVIDEDWCTRFRLNDGTDFVVGLPIESFREHFDIDLQSGSLDSYGTHIFADPFLMSPDLWSTISSLLKADHAVQETFHDYPRLRDLIDFDIGVLRALPLRVYGGSTRQALYLDYPCQFTRREYQTDDTYRNIFFDEPFLAVVDVNPGQKHVSIKTAQRPGERRGVYLDPKSNDMTQNGILS